VAAAAAAAVPSRRPCQGRSIVVVRVDPPPSSSTSLRCGSGGAGAGSAASASVASTDDDAGDAGKKKEARDGSSGGGMSSKRHALRREHRPNVVAVRDEEENSREGGGANQSSSSEWDRIKAGTPSVEGRIVAAEVAARSRRAGQARMRLRQAARREDRILELEARRAAAAAGSSGAATAAAAASGGNGAVDANMAGRDGGHPGNPGLTKAEEAELNGLLAKRAWFEEQYDEATFSEDHKAFKESHNDAFVALSLYCQRERERLKLAAAAEEGGQEGQEEEQQEIHVPAVMFFLDGPEAGTARALVERGGFSADQCYVANRHGSTCQSLRMSGGGILPEENVVHATAAEALSPGLAVESGGGLESGGSTTDEEGGRHDVGSFGEHDFAAYYFDGCGGFAPHVSNMLVAALLRDDLQQQQQRDGAPSSSARSPPIAVGFSLVGGNRDVVDKEVAVCQRLSILARRRGMRLSHVFDDPGRYGIDPGLRKIGGTGGGTLTTWVVLE